MRLLMIHVEKLQKNYRDVQALKGVSFDVAKGEVVGLLGPNGAGKSTTMRIIVGFLEASCGHVTVDGLQVSRDNLETRRLIGYLPESAPLYTDLEVTAYLEYIARLRELEDSAINSRVREMVEVCGLGEVVGRPIAQLSKGYRQRVGLAQAMIHKPPLLILDEPTSGLDPNQIVEIRKLIKEIGKERTVILSTHILQEVEASCSRALIINRGELVAQGSIADLMNKGGGSAYYVAARATRNILDAALSKVSGISNIEWLSNANDERQRAKLRSENGRDYSEDIFQSAVANNLTLSELRRDAASLEEVFRELTQ